MTELYDILSPSSQESYKAWSANITSLNVYELIGPGNSTYSVLARVIDDQERVLESIILETIVPAGDWLDAYVEKLNSEIEGTDDVFDGFEESTTTETTL